jgi:hypothetical protein
MSSDGSSVPVDRVVAVAATLRDGREQLGSGYLISGRQVLTAEHCTRDKVTGESAARLRVIRASDGAAAKVADSVSDRGLDVAVLQLADDTPWGSDLPPPVFARVDQSQSGVLDDCMGIGFPLFQRDPGRRIRHTSEFHGRIYQTDERESGRLLMREPLIHPGPVPGPEGEARSGRGEQRPSPWGGLSGTLMFYRGCAIGVVVEHHPRQGDSALLAIGFERIARSAKMRQCLGLPGPGSLPCMSEQVAVRLVLAGRPLNEVSDPFALEVHRPVRPEDPQPGLPELPTYVPREHDRGLGSVVRAAAEGSSAIAVLVGGSSTGKTRACWEALQLLRDRPEQWRLWHPIDPSRPEAARRELPTIGPRTVVWLNEAQFYLDADGGLGERVAAGLRELLRDPAKAPVLVLATLWPQFWDGLTARPTGGADPHAQARELLAGRDITVPASFTAAQLQRLGQAGDARLAQAAAGAQDGQVIQFLAGAPELLARYRNAPPAAAALIDTAMDARRLGMGIGLPQAFLEAAAPGYLTDAEWDALDEDWLQQALDYTAVPCKGVRGPLTRTRPRPARSQATGPGSVEDQEQLADSQDSIRGVPLYRLADYLDQHGRHHRKNIPPEGFWAAAASHTFPSDQAVLGHAAHNRGLYRDAAQLHKNAAARGNRRAIIYLGDTPHYLRPDIRPVLWAAAHVPLADPNDVGWLLERLRTADAQDQAAVLLRRDPAAHVSLDNPRAVARLLRALQMVDAHDQLNGLLHRDPAGHAPLDDLGAVAVLLDSLRQVGAEDQVTALLRRDPAGHALLDDPWAVADLLGSLRQMGAEDQVAALLRRDPAGHAPLDDPRAVAVLLDRLREAGAEDQVTALADRVTEHVPLDDPYAGAVLRALQRAGSEDQVTALLHRAAEHVRLDDPRAVAELLDMLLEAGAEDQVTALAGRAAERVLLDNPTDVGWLLRSLRQAGAEDQVTALLYRDPAARVSLADPGAAANLLRDLQRVGAEDQVTALLRRDPAAHVALDRRGVAWLLRSLREAGAQDQVSALLRRDPAARVSLADPADVGFLLDSLREAGAQDQVSALLRRDPAAHVPLADPDTMLKLTGSLQRVGAQDQVTTLANRLIEAGMFDYSPSLRNRFPFGREADGSPTEPWGWGDLD